jgi:DeoR/GlpR family transcriptional regulator of sugar metabolism
MLFIEGLNKISMQKKASQTEAVKLIEEGDILFLDASTTCFYLCEEIKKAAFSKLTIITNSLIYTIRIYFK